MFEKVVEIGLLFDFYGKLLNDKQHTAIELYYIHDLSLSEIGEHLGISRQGVHDLIKRTENKLYFYEETLGLVNKFFNYKEKAKIILGITEEIIKSDNNDFNKIKENTRKIKEIALEILEIDQEVK